MNKLINTFNSSVVSFAKEEEGAQVVEYALIIAVVSIALVGLLADTTNGIGGTFTTLVGRIRTCFTAGGVCN